MWTALPESRGEAIASPGAATGGCRFRGPECDTLPDRLPEMQRCRVHPLPQVEPVCGRPVCCRIQLEAPAPRSPCLTKEPLEHPGAASARPERFVGDEVVDVKDLPGDELMESPVSRDRDRAAIDLEEGEPVALVGLPPDVFEELLGAQVAPEL